MFQERTGLIIWVQDNRHVKQLERFGSIHYISKKMHYVVAYVNSDRLEETMRSLQKLHFVKKVELSHRKDIPTEYNSNMPDKTRFYT